MSNIYKLAENNKIIKLFLYAYFKEFEDYINEKKSDELSKISFQSDEANTDRPLKEFIKLMIESNFSTLQDSDIQKMLIICGENDEPIHSCSYNDILNIKINKVLLPEDIPDQLKNKLNMHSPSIKTSPDLVLVIKNNSELYYERVELKSTKKDIIPGGSFLQIDPNEWTIFVKHKKNKSAKLITGKYTFMIAEELYYPDRNPRPHVSFNKGNDWNNNNRIDTNSELSYRNIDSLEQEWDEDYMTEYIKTKWLKLIKENNPKDTRWFNSALRTFSLELIEMTRNLDDKEINNLKANLTNSLGKND
jgi:hypothetical protein